MTLREVDHWSKAIAAALPMNGHLIGVTGGTGAGKTTLCEKLAPHGFAVVYPGRDIRKAMSRAAVRPDAALTERMGEAAPSTTEGIVRRMVEDAIALYEPASFLVDGFPRSVAQAEWAMALAARKQMVFTVIAVEAPVSIREARVIGRGEDWDKAFKDSRLKREAKELYPFLSWLRGKVPHFINVINGVA
jgi:adenylate kinase family enzyme